MYLRIFDKPNKRYYKSMAYCKVSQNGNCQFVVLNPYENCFELVDDLDKSEKSYCPLVEYIQLDSEDWVCYEDENLLEYRQYCKNKVRTEISILSGAIGMCAKTLHFYVLLLKENVLRV